VFPCGSGLCREGARFFIEIARLCSSPGATGTIMQSA
jgi:hypothetical protein